MIIIIYIYIYSSWTNRILAANDFGAVQINVANIDPKTGVFDKTSSTYGICGFIRSHVSLNIFILYQIQI